MTLNNEGHLNDNQKARAMAFTNVEKCIRRIEFLSREVDRTGQSCRAIRFPTIICSRVLKLDLLEHPQGDEAKRPKVQKCKPESRPHRNDAHLQVFPLHCAWIRQVDCIVHTPKYGRGNYRINPCGLVGCFLVFSLAEAHPTSFTSSSELQATS